MEAIQKGRDGKRESLQWEQITIAAYDHAWAGDDRLSLASYIAVPPQDRRSFENPAERRYWRH